MSEETLYGGIAFNLKDLKDDTPRRDRSGP